MKFDALDRLAENQHLEKDQVHKDECNHDGFE